MGLIFDSVFIQGSKPCSLALAGDCKVLPSVSPMGDSQPGILRYSGMLACIHLLIIHMSN